MKYDYIVVGAGFFGATVAERLAAAGKKILVSQSKKVNFSVLSDATAPANPLS